jgi:hypothetical protein
MLDTGYWILDAGLTGGFRCQQRIKAKGLRSKDKG